MSASSASRGPPLARARLVSVVSLSAQVSSSFQDTSHIERSKYNLNSTDDFACQIGQCGFLQWHAM